MAHNDVVTQSWEGFDGFTELIDYPMFVVTARAGNETAGCLVGFTTQASIDPPRFLVGISKKNHTFTVAAAATHLGVHLLARDDLELARWFGGQTAVTRSTSSPRAAGMPAPPEHRFSIPPRPGSSASSSTDSISVTTSATC